MSTFNRVPVADLCSLWAETPTTPMNIALIDVLDQPALTGGGDAFPEDVLGRVRTAVRGCPACAARRRRPAERDGAVVRRPVRGHAPRRRLSRRAAGPRRGPAVRSIASGPRHDMTGEDDMTDRTLLRRGPRLLAAATLTEAALLRLGRAYGSTGQERAMRLPGDEVVPAPDVVTDHAITIQAPPEDVWPWLVQMGWHRGGWYTARWVDRVFFPANRPSATAILPELQDLSVGDFVPDGAPETECGFVVERLEPHVALVLHSTSHLPRAWRERRGAALDWSWAFVLRPVGSGATRFHFRSRWSTAPWWFTLGGRLAIVPADFLMSRDMLRGVKQRAEASSRTRSRRPASAVTTRAMSR